MYYIRYNIKFYIQYIILLKNIFFISKKAALEKHWTLSLCEDSRPRRCPVSQQPLSQKVKKLYCNIL